MYEILGINFFAAHVIIETYKASHICSNLTFIVTNIHPYILFIPETQSIPNFEAVAAQADIESLDVLDQECSEELLPSLAKYCVDWKMIGFNLNITRAEIDEKYRKSEQKQKQSEIMLLIV